jgi:hypothetical protein
MTSKKENFFFSELPATLLKHSAFSFHKRPVRGETSAFRYDWGNKHNAKVTKIKDQRHADLCKYQSNYPFQSSSSEANDQ